MLPRFSASHDFACVLHHCPFYPDIASLWLLNVKTGRPLPNWLLIQCNCYIFEFSNVLHGTRKLRKYFMIRLTFRARCCFNLDNAFSNIFSKNKGHNIMEFPDRKHTTTSVKTSD